MDLLYEFLGLLRIRVWSDVIELLVIGTAVYAVLRFLRGTRGEGLLRGVIILLIAASLVVNLVANVFDLERIKVLYPLFVGGIFLSSLIAFQPELRRALSRLGAARFFGGAAGDVDRVIEETVKAVVDLAGNKIGAIIAFGRSTELGALIEAGCKLDADVSKELLTTIFWPGTTLHDMGVIISSGRLAAAAVPFPMTDSEGLDASLGTRHRAGIGLTQESDAIVVVVSEETGIISVIEDGRLERGFTEDSLRERLRDRLGRRDGPAN